MASTFPDPITKPFCNSGDETPPPEAVSTTVINQETGIPALQSTPLNAGGIPVNRPEFNGTFKYYTEQILAIESGAPYTFNQDISDHLGGYPLGAILHCASNNSFQRSLVNDNTANFITTPSYIDDGINWTSYQHFNEIVARSLIQLNTGGTLNLFKSSMQFVSTNNHNVLISASSSSTASKVYELPPAGPSNDRQALCCDTNGLMYWEYMYTARQSTFTGTLNFTSAGTLEVITDTNLDRDGYWDISANFDIIQNGVTTPKPAIFAISESTSSITPINVETKNVQLVSMTDIGGDVYGSGNIINYRLLVTAAPIDINLLVQVTAGDYTAQGTIVANYVGKGTT